MENYTIGEKVNTIEGLKTIREITHFEGIGKQSILDTFFMKEDCTNTRTNWYSRFYERKEISKILS